MIHFIMVKINRIVPDVFSCWNIIHKGSLLDSNSTTYPMGDSLSDILFSFVFEKYIVCDVCGLRSPSFESSSVLYISWRISPFRTSRIDSGTNSWLITQLIARDTALLTVQRCTSFDTQMLITAIMFTMIYDKIHPSSGTVFLDYPGVVFIVHVLWLKWITPL